MMRAGRLPGTGSFLLTILTSIMGLLATRADHLTFEAEVNVDGLRKKCGADISAPGVKAKPREALDVPVGKQITVKWTATHTGTDEALKDVVIHFFVVKEEKAGQATIPKLDRDVLAESALTMDFKPRDKQTGELTFQIDARGVYLLRVESLGAVVGIGGHEDFAALDLIVK
jgi:hypothetical protein